MFEFTLTPKFEIDQVVYHLHNGQILPMKVTEITVSKTVSISKLNGWNTAEGELKGQTTEFSDGSACRIVPIDESLKLKSIYTHTDLVFSSKQELLEWLAR